MPTLKFNDTLVDNRQAIVERLELDDKQEARLFDKKQAISITDEQLAELQALVNEDGDDDGDTAQPGTDDRNVAQPDTPHPDEDITDVSVASARDRDAVTVGEAISKETNALLVDNYLSKEKLNIMPLQVRDGLIADQIAKGLIPKNAKHLMGSMPYPNSRREQGETVYGPKDAVTKLGSNAPWDRYTYYSVNDDNKQIKKQGSYYVSMARSTPAGKELVKHLKSVTDALASLKPESTVPMPTDWKGFKAPALGRRKRLDNTRLGAIATLIKKAVRLDIQCQAFDSLTNIGYEFETETIDGKEQYVNRNEPVTVFEYKTKTIGGKEQKVPADHFDTSIGAFTRFNVAEAVAAAGGADKVTLDHLRDTVKREQPDDANKKGKDETTKPEIASPAGFHNVMSSVTTYLSNEPSDADTTAKHLAAVLDQCSKDTEYLLVTGDGIVALEGIWNIIQAPYQAASAARSKAKMQEKHHKASDKAA